MDWKGPSDTGPSLDEKWGPQHEPTLRFDLDYPTVSKELRENPTDETIMAFFKDRHQRFWKPKPSPVLNEIRYRNSSSGNLHVELDLDGAWLPSEIIALRSALGDDAYRVLCDSRRALENPIYIGGYLHSAKWVPGQREDGSRGNVIARSGEWKVVQ